MRKQVILDMLSDINMSLNDIDVFVGRGGILKPITSGTYLVNEAMLKDLHSPMAAMHASCLGGIIAHNFAVETNKKAYVVDPIVVDEMEDNARLSGMPEIERKSRFHALNQKAVAREYAKDNKVKYEEQNLIVAHMGGGITIGAHKMGRVIDVNDGLAGEGPFSPERSGTLPLDEIIKVCYSGEYTEQELLKRLQSKVA